MTIPSYLPLPTAMRDARSSLPLGWRRRATYMSLVAVSVFLLFEYASYLSAGTEDLQDAQDSDASVDPTLDTAYLPFQPPRQGPLRRKLRPTVSLPAACLDAHLSKGELCYNPAEPRLDVLWTWVNGSDILLQDAKKRVQASLASDDPRQPSSSWKSVRQFRDHDELRYSMRSVLANFRPYLGSFHLLTTDFAIPDTAENITVPTDYRLGQVPQWLNVEQRPWTDGHVDLSITHHAQIFHPYEDNIFNSYAIESQFGHLEDISENFIYLNDDFFFLNHLTPRTFYTSAYGLVFRMQSDLLVAPTQYRNNVKGEWRSLAASNRMLSDRFGVRHRPYVTHEAKGASLALLHEMAQMWYTQFAATATHPFRETKLGNADPSIMFMLVHFTVERWREALLWSWAVARHGAVNDAWTPETTARAWAELGGAPGEYGVLGVHAGRRATVEPDRVSGNLRASGHKQVDGTVYEFSALDGYPYLNFDPDTKDKRRGNKWPRYTRAAAEADLPQCTIDYAKCFVSPAGKPFTTASELFKHVAFREPQCGDCMTLALVRASGELGLEAFLPSGDRVVSPPLGNDRSPEYVDPTPHLPLSDRWEDGEFALAEVLRGTTDTNVRAWTLRLLDRYRFVIGDTPAHFAMLSGPSAFSTMLKHLQKHPDIALLCVNDDVAIDDDKVAAAFQQWARERWSTPAAWER